MITTKSSSSTTDAQSALFQSRKRFCSTIQEALDGAAAHLQSGKLQEQIADVFSGGFGPEPYIQYQVTIRQDAATPGAFSYMAQTKIGHEVGKSVKLYSLKP